MFPVEPRRGETLLDNFDRMLERYCGPIKETGLNVYVALGVHPANAHFREEQNYDTVFRALPGYLTRENVVAVGEIGLEALDGVERMVLRRQLEIARDLGKPAVIHTPGKRKAEALTQTLDVVREAAIPPELVVLDHMTEDLVPAALAFGGKVGLTVKEGKLGIEDVVRILRSHSEEVSRFVVNSDLGYSASTQAELTVVRTAADRIAGALGLDVAARVCRDNAAELFGITIPQLTKPRRRLRA
jgi:predicted metal-dependent TIM-barrel fold hydrolase